MDESLGFADGAERLLRHARSVGNELAGMADTVSAMAQTMRDGIDLRRHLEEAPVRTLLVAAGVGYVAGGGFFTPFTRRLLRAGARLWLIPALKNQLNNEGSRTHDVH